MEAGVRLAMLATTHKSPQLAMTLGPTARCVLLSLGVVLGLIVTGVVVALAWWWSVIRSNED